jgi:hypothetical protein
MMLGDDNFTESIPGTTDCPLKIKNIYPLVWKVANSQAS